MTAADTVGEDDSSNSGGDSGAAATVAYRYTVGRELSVEPTHGSTAATVE